MLLDLELRDDAGLAAWTTAGATRRYKDAESADDGEARCESEGRTRAASRTRASTTHYPVS